MPGQLGLEPTFQEYVAKLCAIFDEVKRVLKKEGTCWAISATLTEPGAAPACELVNKQRIAARNPIVAGSKTVEPRFSWPR